MDTPSEVGEVLVDAERLRERVAALAREISRDYAATGGPLLLIGVLKGAMFFLSDLMRQIDIPVEVDFMAVASYGSATDSSGVVRILKDLDAAIDDRDVLIVEDIVDSGLTLQYLLRNLGSREPRTLEVCALLMKPPRAKIGHRAAERPHHAAERLPRAAERLPRAAERLPRAAERLPRAAERLPRYVGFEIPDRFVIGYGLDYAERHRNLPFVAALEVQ